MKRLLIIWLTLTSISAPALAQRYYDSLQHSLSIAKEDTNKVRLYYLMAGWFESTNSDSNHYYAQNSIKLSEKLDYRPGIFFAGISQFYEANFKADYTRTLAIALHNLELAETLKDDNQRKYAITFAQILIGVVRGLIKDTSGRVAREEQISRLTKEMGQLDGDFWVRYLTVANRLLQQHKLDSAYYFIELANYRARHATHQPEMASLCAAYSGNSLLTIQDFEGTRKYYREGIELANYYNNTYVKTKIYRDLIHFYNLLKKPDSAIYFGRMAIDSARKYSFTDYTATASDSLARMFEELGQVDSALHYSKINRLAKDSVFSNPQIQKFDLLIRENERKQAEAEAARERFQNKIRLYASLSAFGAFLLISGILYRNNRQKQKANALLVNQREEITRQRTKAEDALEELKTTQAQLIQREKMASLGELTAGVAHEIQNPLNFVNNFAELNTELLDELEQEFKAGHASGVLMIAENIRQNMTKINQHGKRADAIVKGMLQHSRVNSGQKELADLNLLAEEYLNLTYHGFRAREKEFSCQIDFHPDSSIPKIRIVPQDMGRVFLNLFNNAFYSMKEKPLPIKGNEDYHPLLIVSTKYINSPSGAGAIEIRIRDNGMGIPQNHLDKVYQPFFTTKPTGQGTGLGLSLSYDIITKEHAGTIAVDSKEGEYAEFVIQLPIQ
jgi:signal transduction histidine kinase